MTYGIVDVFGRVEGEQRVVVDVSRRAASCPRQKLATTLPRSTVLRAPVTAPDFDQINDAVGDHLGVDAEVLLVLEETEQRLRNAADADFNRGTVLDQRRDVLGDLPRHLRHFRRRHFQDRRLRRAPARQCRRRE